MCFNMQEPLILSTFFLLLGSVWNSFSIEIKESEVSKNVNFFDSAQTKVLINE